MGTVKSILAVLVSLGVCGLALPSVVSAQALADTCEPCNVNADCISNNCGVNVNDPNDKRCIPAGATSYNCADDSSSGCFVDAVSRFDEQAFRSPANQQ